MKENTSKNAELFKRFIENNYSAKDIGYLVEWINDRGSERSLNHAFKEYWYHHFDDIHDSGEDASLEKVLDRIHHRINLAGDQPVSAPDAIRTRKILSASRKIFYRVAAVMFFPLMFFSLSYFLEKEYLPVREPAYNEIYAPMGSRVRFDLPDGSYAWLNHGSMIRYPQQFSGDIRELYLAGEAYFDVKEDPEHPFIVNTSGIDVYAVGTSFNVKAYENDPSIEVTLVEGKVDIYGYEEDMGKEMITGMTPGEHVVIDQNTGHLVKSRGETNTYTAWKQGQLILRDDPMDVIAGKLEKWYNVDIELLDPQLSAYTFRGTFSNETLPQVMNLLSIAAPLEYTIFAGVRQSDDTFSRSRVVIQLKR